MCVVFVGFGFCIYVFYIHFVYMCCWGVCLVKVLRSFRFDREVYGRFVGVCGAGGLTVTGAFMRFMLGCVGAGRVLYVDAGVADFELEARVLVDWLVKGKRFYRGEDGCEVNIQARLFSLISKVQDNALKSDLEKALKGSVCGK